MGRSSSTLSPFLVPRPDSGKYVYQRKLPPELRPLAVGTVSLPWKARLRALEAQTTIKISLGTGDLPTARTRRDEIHVQVEAIVERARSRLDALNRAKLAMHVGDLAAAEIRSMAGQTRHDILVADDEAAIDRAWRSPLSDLILAIRAGAGLATSTGDVVQTAQDLEHRKAKGDLIDRDVRLFDQAIEEGHIEADDDLVDRLLKISEVADPTKMRLDKADVATLFKRPQDVETIPGPVDAALSDNNIALPPDHPDRRRLALELLRAKVAAYNTVVARRAGDPTETPPRPEPITPPVAVGTLSAMRTRWIELYAPKKKARDDNWLYLSAFIAIHGDLPVDKVTRKMVRGFRDLLKERPRNMPNAVAKLALKDQVAWGKTQDNCRLITKQTVNAKGIGAISAIMEAAIKDDLIAANPCAGQLLPVKGRALARAPYDAADLERLFSSPIYAADKRQAGGGGEAQFWFPLIGLLAGGRLEEIGQLMPDDIRTRGGITFFDFIDIDGEAETKGTEKTGKDLKTPAARREVPVHPFLIEIGFLRYVARMKVAGHRRLFPYLTAYQGKLTKNWSRWWGRYARQHVTKSTRKVFHSFRHAFADLVRKAAKGDENIVKALMGHQNPMYGKAIDLATRDRIVRKLKVEGVDLSIVKEAAKRLGL